MADINTLLKKALDAAFDAGRATADADGFDPLAAGGHVAAMNDAENDVLRAIGELRSAPSPAAAVAGAETASDELEAILGSRHAHQCAGFDCAQCEEFDNELRDLISRPQAAGLPDDAEYRKAANAYAVQLYGITYDELRDRVAAINRGEFTTHEEVMRNVGSVINAAQVASRATHGTCMRDGCYNKAGADGFYCSYECAEKDLP